MRHTAHEQTPDVDNLAKALLDSLGKTDADYWDIRCSKVWTFGPKIVVYNSTGEPDVVQKMVTAIIQQDVGYTYVPGLTAAEPGAMLNPSTTQTKEGTDAKGKDQGQQKQAD